jgi:biopolymer transport protein TolQ
MLLGPLAGLIIFSLATAALAQTLHQSNLQSWLGGVDLLKLLRQADMLGKISLVILAGFSIASWTVIVYKFLHLRQAVRQTDQFVDLCNQGSGELEEAFRISSSFPDSPLAQILREGYLELEIENWYRGEGYDLSSEARLELAKVSMERIFERTISNEISHLESKIPFLATTTSVCPFIGLFGTVWGIMGAFQTVGNQATVALSQLAPGISTALLCTVGGLFCAIPATVMYNFLALRVRVMISRMDSFSLELSNVIQKQVMKQSVQTYSR